MNWFSIIILAIPVAYIFGGVQKGMIRTAFSFLSVILTLVLSFALNPQITEFVQEKTPIYEMIQENCQASIARDTETKLSEETNSGEQNQFIQELPLPDSVKEILIENNNTQGYEHFLAETFSEYISHSIATIAVSILGMIQGIFVVWIVFLVLSLFWDTAWAQRAVAMVQENSMTNYLYENNLLAQLLAGLF